MYNKEIYKKHLIYGGGDGCGFNGVNCDDGLKLSISYTNNKIKYITSLEDDTSVYYNKINSVKFIGAFMESKDMDLFEIKGEFKCRFYNSKLYSATINDVTGRYSINCVTYYNNHKF